MCSERREVGLQCKVVRRYLVDCCLFFGLFSEKSGLGSSINGSTIFFSNFETAPHTVITQGKQGQFRYLLVKTYYFFLLPSMVVKCCTTLLCTYPFFLFLDFLT